MSAFHVPMRVGTPFVRRLVLDLCSLGVALTLFLSAYPTAAQGTVSGLIVGALLLGGAGWIVLRSMPPFIASIRLCFSRPFRLRLDDDGITLVHGEPQLTPAFLSWADCAALVVSPLPLPNGKRLNYVQFVPVRDDRVQFTPIARGADLMRAKAVVCRVSEAAAAMIWFSPPKRRAELERVVAAVVVRRPGLRVVTSLKD